MPGLRFWGLPEAAFAAGSPACSSFDKFNDYEDRGNQFKNIVMNLSAIENTNVKMDSL